MASIDISQLRNVSSGAIKAAEMRYRDVHAKDESFTSVLGQALDTINKTNGYLSDAENEEIKWALGKTENTHDLTIALQKAQTALQYTIAVRDRALSAYREITQMQI